MKKHQAAGELRHEGGKEVSVYISQWQNGKTCVLERNNKVLKHQYTMKALLPALWTCVETLIGLVLLLLNAKTEGNM